MALREYLADEVVLDCSEGHFGRREALRRLALLGVGAATASAMLAGCGDDDAGGDTSAAGSAAGGTHAAELVTFPGSAGQLVGAYAAPDAPRGAVLVIHENRGLTPHIASIPPRLAADGYAALALDLLSPEGGTASLGDEGRATALLGQAPEERLVADLRAGLDELARRHPDAPLAVIGFCFGGGMTWRLLAAGEPRLAAAVPFYGPAPAGADFSGSRAAVLAVYAGNDDRVNASRDAVAGALAAAGLEHEIRTFDGVDHAFFNDTGPRYDEAAATQAYREMLAWFERHLG